MIKFVGCKSVHHLAPPLPTAKTTATASRTKTETFTAECIRCNFYFLCFQECQVTCVDLIAYNNEVSEEENNRQKSVCLQCPDGTAGDGKECRGTQYTFVRKSPC